MPNPIQLNQQNLARLPGSVARPAYDRRKVTAGIVHVGVGGFHRSHAACYTDELLSTPGATAWGICGVGVRDADRNIAKVLKRQDHLYTLIVKHPDGRVEHRVLGSIVDFVLGPDHPAAVIDQMADAKTRIVSLTITEGGYNLLPATGAFDLDHPDVKHDLANPHRPRMVFGHLTEALSRRRAAGQPAFTVQSCDNIEHNGDVTRRMLLAYAHERDPELAAWIADEARFPNAMVDRITPVTTAADITALQADTGVQDAWPVTCEPFCQWVIEDTFADGRPAWEAVGAQFVTDVTPYETMKLRLLNAGHSVLGLLGSIHGHQTIDGCMADPLFATCLRRFMDDEVTPVLDPVEGIDLNDYKDSLIERFGNPSIKDSLARICLESSAKLPKFLLPTVHDNLRRGGSIACAALVVAAWCYICDKGVSQHGDKLDIVDEKKAQLHRAAAGTARDRLSFLKLTSVFGELAHHQAFTAQYVRNVEALYENPDIRRQMQALVAEQS